MTRILITPLIMIAPRTINGFLKMSLRNMLRPVCVLTTSVVVRVMSDGIENLSMLSISIASILSNIAVLRLRPKPIDALALKY